MDNNMDMGEDICYCRRCMGTVYVVKEGDTIYSIARRYGITVNDILNSNRFVNIYNLQIGDKLCIPVGMDAMPERPAPPVPPAPQMPPMQPMPPRPQPGPGPVIMPRDNNMTDNTNNMNNWSMDYERNGAFELNEIEGMEVAGSVNNPMGSMSQCKNCGSCRFNGSTKMSDICNDPDMTFEEFVNCFKMFDK